MKEADKTYSFSFMAISMKVHALLRVARYVCDHQLNIGVDALDQEAILEKGNERTSRRQFQELSKRLVCLTPSQQKLLLKSDMNTQKQLSFLSMCKTYKFIHDLVVEVIREKFLVFDYEFTDGDYRTFFNRKCDQHPELEEFAESTQKKVKQVTFKILEQAGIIDDVRSRIIQPQILEDKLMKVVIEDSPTWMKVFLISDKDIQRTIANDAKGRYSKKI